MYVIIFGGAVLNTHTKDQLLCNIVHEWDFSTYWKPIERDSKANLNNFHMYLYIYMHIYLYTHIYIFIYLYL